MSHYKPYLTYKDSGVEWLGKVPEHWDVKPLRWIASYRNSNVDKKSYEGQQTVRLCNYTDVYYNEFIRDSMEFMSATASDEEIKSMSLVKGEIVITKDSEDPSDIGIPSIVIEDLNGVVCGYHLTIIRVSPCFSSFLHRAIQSTPSKAHFQVESPGITRFGLNQGAIGSLKLALPPPEECQSISAHIDRETARIDTLVKRKVRFIELLREKRHAMITHAVTKGLDSSAKMKDSEVEWLGEVPELWHALRVKQAAAFITSGPRGWSEFIDDNGAEIFLQSGDLNNSLQILPDSAKKISAPKGAEGARTKLQANDVVVCITGANTGRVATVSWLPATTYINQHLCLIRLNSERLLSKFLALYLSSNVGRSYFEVTQSGLKEGLSLSDIADAPLPLPPVHVQAEICAYLDREIIRIDTLVEKTERSIVLLKERRAAFITAAVTGQIKLPEAA